MILARLLALPMAMLLAASAAGMDMDYEGEIDIVTGRPVTDSSSSDVVPSQQTVILADGVSYDRTAHNFSYATPDRSGYIRSSVANGMITTSKVSVDIPDGLSVSLYRDGEPQPEMDTLNIVDAGSYALVMTNSESQYQILNFRIVPEKTGAITAYDIPDGFTLQTLDHEGDAQDTTGVSSVDLQKDGKYRMTYRCDATGIDYSLSVTIDHTPPEITLEGVTDGMAKGPVTVKGLEKSDRVTVTRDKTQLTEPLLLTNVLKTPGAYHIVVTDDAGNTTVKDFTIRFYLNSQGLVFTLIALASFAGVLIYMYVSKKRLKVR